jgi:hypothetical protein
MWMIVAVLLALLGLLALLIGPVRSHLNPIEIRTDDRRMPKK